MLDIKFIREHKAAVAKAAKDKNIDLDINELLEVDDERKAIQQKVETLNGRKKENAGKMRSAADEQKTEIAEEGKEIKNELAELESQVTEIENRWHTLMLRVPNIPSEDTPIGSDESGNVEVDKWGDPAKFDFEPKDHLELAEGLNLIDTERGVKVAGFRGYFLKNELAMMHVALMMISLQRLQEKGFEIMISPTMIRQMGLVASGHFPAEKDEIYDVTDNAGEGKKEDKFLVGTSEPSLLGYHADEILDEADLPRTMAAFSPCYRREVGGYGKDTRGVFRVHEFLKVEQVVLCKNDVEEGLKWHEAIKENALELLRDLGLPHRVIQICTGDMGAGKYKMYDIETWMPSRNAYSETHSVSYLTDWQARRAKIRYRTKDGEIKFAHTLNNTMIASPRILIAILENFQKKDGSIEIPKLLRPYMRKQKALKPQK